MAYKLKQILPQLISQIQGAFVSGHLIMDNVLVAYEMLHSMHCKKTGKKRLLALKLDINKAYDRVEWNFLKNIMSKLGFSDVWIERVMTCVSTLSFLVRINGKAYDNITLTRGLRQGDLLSSYLFLLCAKGFIALLAKAEVEGRLITDDSLAGEHQRFPTYYLLMIHCCFAKQHRRRCGVFQIHYSCMQHHPSNVSTLRNPLFILAATHRGYKEKQSKMSWG